ncbi:MAG TPA: DUF4270 family protein [bacterium]|nr:DUF4270 family protein [bacterium]HPR87904.1 DUF4270 family protein [bacterium]
MISYPRLAAGMRIALFSLLLVTTALFVLACSKNTTEPALGEKYIESQAGLTVIDTFTVSLSTVILDTFVNSGTGSMLVGISQDDRFGKISSTSCLQLGIPASYDVEADDVYDSLRLVLTYNEYVTGDTTVSQKINVHQLREKIDLQDEQINTSTVALDYDPEPIGTLIYSPRPHRTPDTLVIPISDAIGQALFSRMQEDAADLADVSHFIDYFHGLMLRPDEAYPGAIVGFSAGTTTVSLRLYASRGGIEHEKIVNSFNLYNVNAQFNSIQHDFTATPFTALTEQRHALPATLTEGKAFLKGGIGVVMRVDFPTLGELLLRERGKLVEAKLMLAPEKNSYREFELPTQLILQQADKLNRISASQIAAGTLSVDEFYDEETYYTFNITDYLNNELADSWVDPEKGLVVSMAATTLKSRLDRLIIDAGNKHTRLKIYYLSY